MALFIFKDAELLVVSPLSICTKESENHEVIQPLFYSQWKDFSDKVEFQS